MRCEDTLLFKDNDVAIQIEKDRKKYYKPEQIAFKIDQQKVSGLIESGMKITEKHSNVIKYIFYLKDYLKRKDTKVKSAISVYTSKDFYNEYHVIYVLLNRSVDAFLEIQNANEFALAAPSILEKESSFLMALDLPKLFKRVREARLEKQMEQSLLEETIRFCL